MTLRPTVRGVAVAVVGGSAIGMAYAAGPRALNVVAAPAAVALLAAIVQILLADATVAERPAPKPGFPGARRTVTMDLDGSGVARLVETLSDGVVMLSDEVRATLPATVSYEIGLDRRGAWPLGPSTVVLSDVLGLFVRTVEVEATTEALVYPRVYDLRDHEALAGLFVHGAANDRQAFDSIREYAPGDPLRDVHWKSSAKRSDDELVVKQFVAEEATEEFHVVASADQGHGDTMASGAASVALLALEAGLSVSVTCPAGAVKPGRGQAHRSHVLELLARTGDGSVDDHARDRADVLVTGQADGFVVTVDGRDYRLAPWTDGQEAETGDRRDRATDVASSSGRAAAGQTGATADAGGDGR